MSRSEPVHALVLAAGLSTRMKSARSKVLQPLQGEPLVRRVVRLASVTAKSVLVVVSHQEAEVRAALEGTSAQFVRQAIPRGTADAVRAAIPWLRRREGIVLILCGDAPLLRPRSLSALLDAREAARAPAAVLTALAADPAGYGRIVRDAAGRVGRIVEERDATDAERKIREVNTGVYAIRIPDLLTLVRKIDAENSRGEFYLTDLFALLSRGGRPAIPWLLADPVEAIGVNTRADLAQAHRALWDRKAAELLEAGVTLLDPAQAFIDEGVEVGEDTEIAPAVILQGQTRIGAGCRIGPFTRISDSEIGPGAEVRSHCEVEGARVGGGAILGPFARLRPGSVLGEGARVGNFVELKKTRLGAGSKANHLAYLGDAEIGPGVNVGAGTITCNYDGASKHPTVIDEGAFIGSNTALVAPVRIGRGAYVAAGSTITEDVPDGALGLGRARQTNKKGWAAARRRAASKKTPARGGRAPGSVRGRRAAPGRGASKRR